MNTPPFLLFATLCFWGWRIGWPWAGIVVGATLELPRFFKSKWDFQQPDLDRIWNLCVMLFVGAAVYVFTAGEGREVVGDLLRAESFGSRSVTLNQGARAVLTLFQWVPLTLLPIALAQSWLAGDGMDLSTFSWWLRRMRPPGGSAVPGASTRLNIGYLYFCVCLFSASAAPGKSLWFVAGLSVLVSWALWARRPRGFSMPTWSAALLSAVLLGAILQAGLAKLQGIWQRLDAAIMAQLSGGRPLDLKESRTALGSIGRLKLSGRIVWRLQATNSHPPELIREAAYNLFQSPVWGASDREFSNLTPESDSDSSTWLLQDTRRASGSVTIAGLLPGGQGLLPLPLGAVRLENLPVFLLQTNALGMARSEEGPGFVQFQASFDQSRPLDRPPDANDLQIAHEERAGLQRVAAALSLPRPTPEETLQTVMNFFATGFRYSVWRGLDHLSTPERTALEAFLTEHRSGHCEYFATATALLLRQAGVPTRYAVGYSVQEQNGDHFVVRERHAHAWCLVWIDKRWREIDTTPGDWRTVESERASSWEPWRDFFNRLRFEFSKWRWGNSSWKRYLNWLIVPLLGLAIVRLIMTKPWQRARQTRNNPLETRAWPGQDSEYYLIANHLMRTGPERQPGETAAAWIARLGVASDAGASELAQVLDLHYRLRFDPQGLRPAERTALRHRSHHWLAAGRERASGEIARTG